MKVGVPYLLATGLGVALLAGLSPSGARARRAEQPGPAPSRRKRSSKRRRTTPVPPAPLRKPPKPKPTKRKARKPAAVPLNKEYVITSTKGEPIKPHKVRVKVPTPPKANPSAPSLSPRAGAQRLYDYAGAMLHEDRGSELGTKGRPNKTVRAYQEAMGGILADGIYGPNTRSRGKELLGKTFPARVAKPRARVRPAPPPPPPPPPEPSEVPEVDELPNVRTPKEAAQDLFDYAKRAPKVKGRGAWFGLRNKPSATVRHAQRDMGELVDDGIYGPRTRKRGRALLGRVFPAR